MTANQKPGKVRVIDSGSGSPGAASNEANGGSESIAAAESASTAKKGVGILGLLTFLLGAAGGGAGVAAFLKGII